MTKHVLQTVEPGHMGSIKRKLVTILTVLRRQGTVVLGPKCPELMELLYFVYSRIMNTSFVNFFFIKGFFIRNRMTRSFILFTLFISYKLNSIFRSTSVGHHLEPDTGIWRPLYSINVEVF